MRFAYTIGGGAPVYKKYQIAASVTTAGVPLLIPAADGAGLAAATTTSLADMVGCTFDTATYVTAQQTDGTSAERTVGVIINPDAVWAALLSQGATLGAALTLRAVTTASATGLVVTTAESWTGTEYDEGVVWGYDGANAGQARKITSTSATAGTVTVPFDQDTVVGDNFIRAPYWPVQSTAMQLTTNLDGADASIAVGTGGGAKCVELILGNLSNSGRTDSWTLWIPTDHCWGPRPT